MTEWQGGSPTNPLGTQALPVQEGKGQRIAAEGLAVPAPAPQQPAQMWQ